jgi:uncharacterized membrane protein
MTSKAAITVHLGPEEVRALWSSPEHRSEYLEQTGATVTFKDAPGDRGTEIHVEAGKDRGMVSKLTAGAPLAKIKNELRRFKQRVETGEVPRSEGSPEGELVERKLKQRPAQPLAEDELAKVGA